LDLRSNLCIAQYFASGSFLNVAQQQAFEIALETCNKQYVGGRFLKEYVANSPGNSSSLLNDLANLLQNFFVDMSSYVLNVNYVLTNHSLKVRNFTKYV
jgi:hypothetical protein